MEDTVQQKAFLDALLHTNSHLALIARAGTGKTSTILRGVQELVKTPGRKDICVCAYNKAIADEINHKLKQMGISTEWVKDCGRNIPPSVQAQTSHALGFSLIRTVFRDIKLDEDKVKKLIEARQEFFPNDGSPGPQIYKEWGSQVAQLVGYAKGAGVGFFSDLPISSTQVWFDLADHYDVNGVDDLYLMEEIVAAAQVIYKASLEKVDTIDFDDMILWPLIKNLRVKWGKTHLFLDEAQDLSRARQALAKKFVQYPNGRMIIVGDDRQAIYGFSGADAAALHNLVTSMSATTLPLTVTWRCPKSVVELAQTLVPDIQAAPSAKDGEILSMLGLPFEALTSADALLCRNTAPLIKYAYACIRKGIACKVEGRAIGDGLNKLITRWKVKTIDALLGRLEVYKEREMQKAIAKGSEAKAEEVKDKCDTLKEICDAVLAKGQSRVDDVKQFISDLFADGQKDVLTLATYHRSKGREWPTVYLLEHYQRCPSRAARQAWQRKQEENLAYVAFTRAKEKLVFIGE